MAPSAPLHIAYALLAGTAGFAVFRDKGNTIAESGAYALMGMLMLHAWSAQVALLAGGQRFLPFALALLGIPAIRVIQRHPDALRSAAHSAARFIRRTWLPSCALAAAWVGVAALNVRGIHLERAAGPAIHPLLTTLDASLLTAAGAADSPPLIVLNHLVMAAAWQPDAVVIMANLSAWLSIALCTYALARRYTWPATAVTVALLVVCMPRVLQQSWAVHSELQPSAAVLISLLALYRAVEQPHAHDLAMLSAGVSFSVAGGRLAYLMPAVLAGLVLIVLKRRHPLRNWPRAMVSHRPALLVALAAVAVFSHFGVVLVNLLHGKAWVGVSSLDEVAFNMDGLGGALANTGRYLWQSIHLTEVGERLAQSGFGFSLRGALETAHRNTWGTLLNGRGAAAAFQLSWTRGSPWEWFGPAGFLMILPAIAYALRRAPRRLKSTAAAMLAYFLAIALILAWQPQNVRYLTPFFTGSGFLVAFFLPPWRISRRGRLVLNLFSILMAGYTLMPP